MTADLNDPSSLLGFVINQKYKILDLIGTGGMGRVFKAEQLPLGRLVAIKTVRGPSEVEEASEQSFEKRFFLEASYLARLQHPNLVAVFDYGEIKDAQPQTFYMAMEFLPGETLHRRLRAHGKFSPPEAVNIVKQIARGLREAHALGIVHRDLKPGNVMLCPSGEDQEIVKVLDFGLVKVVQGESEDLTQAGTFLGSPSYIPPEQVRGSTIDARADLYSLGVVFYELLAGVTPFTGTTVELLLSQVNKKPPPFEQRVPGLAIPEPIETLVFRCLEKDPSKRPDGMEGFLQELKECELAIPKSAPSRRNSTAPSSRSGAFDASRSGSHSATSAGPHKSQSASRSGAHAQAAGPNSAALRRPPVNEEQIPKLPPPPRLPRDSMDLVEGKSAQSKLTDNQFYALVAVVSLVLMISTFLALRYFTTH